MRFDNAFNTIRARHRDYQHRVEEQAKRMLNQMNTALNRTGVHLPSVDDGAITLLARSILGTPVNTFEGDAMKMVCTTLSEYAATERSRQAAEAEEARRDADAEAVAAEALAELRPEQRRALVRLSSRLGGLLDGCAASEEDE